MTDYSPIQTPVAIIGMGCIFAKSPDLKSYWHLLSSGTSGISDPPPTHANLMKYLDPDPKRPDHIYTNRGGFIPATDFDPTEFGIPPNALEATDTSQLLGLITAQKALEDAGYGNKGKAFSHNNTSVILGITGTQELVIPLGSRLGHPLWRDAMYKAGVPSETVESIVSDISGHYVSWQENSFPGLLGNVVAGRIANRLDLGGTNCVVDAACASSMGAIHLALMELETRRADMVISGGVDTINDVFMHMCFAKTHILSASGDIRPFSKDADGTLLGEGVGLVVLKRLSDAQRDGDRVYAVIKGLGSGSDGKSQSIYAPKPEGQAQALQRAYTNAGVDPGQVGLVEAHGTGTRVGDGVEFQALCQIFSTRQTNNTQNFCALGSVKSNIGHTKAAAGSAGLMKAALSLYHKNLPPTLNAEMVDPKLNISESPFYINQNLRPWVQPGKQKRIAGVSAFGFGGSNFHVVLEEAERNKPLPSWSGNIDIITFSDKTKQGLIDQFNKWHDSVILCENKQDIRSLSQKTRNRFRSTDLHRLLIVLQNELSNARIEHYFEAGIDKITSGLSKPTFSSESIFYGEAAPSGGLAFLFPGQGSQYIGMGRQIICSFPQSFHSFEDAVAFFNGNPPLDEYIYPKIIEDLKLHEANLRATDIAQPAIGAVSCSMFQVLQHFGIRPDATCGHSYGELVALFAAGWISQSDLWRLSIARGRLMASACEKSRSKGRMLAVMAPIRELETTFKSDTYSIPDANNVVLANLNGPNQGILSGSETAIEKAERICREKGWKTLLLPVSGAFHSPQMSDAVIPFNTLLDEIEFAPTQIPVMSNAIGDRYSTEISGIKSALGGQLTRPVNFISNIEKLYDQGIHTFIEVGPKSVLTGLVHSILAERRCHTFALDASSGRDDQMMDLAKVLCSIAALGYPVAIDRWEDSVEQPPRKMRMNIPLSGANYKSPKTAVEKKKDPQAIPKISPDDTSNDNTMPLNQKSTIAVLENRDKNDGRIQEKEFRQKTSTVLMKEKKVINSVSSKIDNGQFNKMATYSDDFLKQTISAVQQGLSTMQTLQAQTTKAHQKFLEGQEAANRALFDMVQSVQNLIIGKIGPISDTPDLSNRTKADDDTVVKPAALATRIAQPVEEKTHSTGTKPVVTPERPVRSPGPLPESKIDVVSEKTGNVFKTTIEQAVTSIVSDLTGYPEQMLGMDMDIESDLGIDSIKRVEILSTVEEQMPELPKVTPEMLGDLKTLGQICAYLSSSSAAHDVADTRQIPSSENQMVDNSDLVADVVAIQKALVAIVSDLTGYPEQMLGMDMDIESDLGIDSIKRVEILSTVEEQMPDLPKVTPEMLGDLKTLGQICAYLSSSSSVSHGAANMRQIPLSENQTADGSNAIDDGIDIQKALVAIISDLTGYPEQMLGMDMDIESDLGIDSIKRVEILSTVEEQMPDLPKVTPEMLGDLKTLGQICTYLFSSSSVSHGAANMRQIPLSENQTADGSNAIDDGIDIQKALVAIVSDLTGYPEQMLGMDMDIESDLGIDSIKRVEILSAVEEQMPDLPKVTPEMLGDLKTLDQICTYLAGRKNKNTDAAEPPHDDHVSVSSAIIEDDERLLDRFIVEPIQIEPLKHAKSMEDDGTAPTPTIIVSEDDTLAQALAKELELYGFPATIASPELPDEIDTATGCVIILSPVSPKQAFLWAKLVSPILQKRSDQGMKSLFCTITFMDGVFGFADRMIENPMQGALAGLVKTAALEWPKVICRAFDIDPSWSDLQGIAKNVSTEIQHAVLPNPIEIGLTEDSRYCLRLVPSDPPSPASIDLNPNDVVVVTGGARGVTATAAKYLAKKTGCRLALVGRSEEPTDEPEWLNGLITQNEIKKAVFKYLSEDGRPTPKEVERLYRYWMANREILHTLDELRHDGIHGRYFSADVRDASEISILFDRIRNSVGPIKAFIHGAGILKDRLIEEKTPEQFDLVFGTKVDGLASLLQATVQDNLRYIILFSSISGRIGNIGQADYAMANEVLNKTAAQLAWQNHTCKIVSFNWGPWNGGMVTEELKRHFHKKGISLIEPHLGAQAMVTEMASADRSPVEVIIGGLFGEEKTDSNVRQLSTKQKRVVPTNEKQLNLTAKRQIVLKQFPILESHYLDGRPVVPLALITEWLAHGALHANPGLKLHGIDNLRLFKGIFLESNEKNISILRWPP